MRRSLVHHVVFLFIDRKFSFLDLHIGTGFSEWERVNTRTQESKEYIFYSLLPPEKVGIPGKVENQTLKQWNDG